MRIDKFLSNSTKYSRTEIKKYIKLGKVKVNDIIIKDSSTHIIDTDLIYLNDTLINYNKYRYFVLNKPSGYVSATIDNVSKTVIDILKDEHKNLSLFPVGRLDKDTEGLLILTNDGIFSHNSLSPTKHVFKKYYVEVEGVLDNNDVTAFFNGITIDNDVLLKSAKLEIIKSSDISTCYVTISQGKFHQVKKMFRAIDKYVLYLKRVSFGNFNLPEDLKTGEYRELTDTELKILLGENNE